MKLRVICTFFLLIICAAPASALDEARDLVGCFLAISDDKSEYAPARFVSVKLDYDTAHVATPVVTATTILRDAKAEPYPAPGKGGEALDSESLRLDPKSGTLLITKANLSTYREQLKDIAKEIMGSFDQKYLTCK